MLCSQTEGSLIFSVHRLSRAQALLAYVRQALRPASFSFACSVSSRMRNPTPSDTHLWRLPLIMCHHHGSRGRLSSRTSRQKELLFGEFL